MKAENEECRARKVRSEDAKEAHGLLEKSASQFTGRSVKIIRGRIGDKHTVDDVSRSNWQRRLGIKDTSIAGIHHGTAIGPRRITSRI